MLNASQTNHVINTIVTVVYILIIFIALGLGRRYEPILGYIPVVCEKQFSGSQRDNMNENKKKLS